MKIMDELKKIESAEDMQDDLQCPVCLKIPRTAPIYQCSQGHIHCEACHPRLEECPVCRSSIAGDIRNLVMEKILERLPTKCVNFENGCQQPADLPQVMIKHEKHCDFRMVTCLVSNCEEKFILSDIEIHFREKHSVIRLDLDHSVIRIDTDFDKLELIESEMTRVEFPIHYLCYNDRHFLIRIYVQKGFFQFAVYVLSADDVDNYNCRLYAKGRTLKTNIDVRGYINLIDCEKSEVIPILTMSCNQLKKMVNRNGKLEFFLQIMPIEDNKFEVTDEKSSDFLMACRDGNIQLIEQFVKQPKQINFNARDLTGMTGFMHACSEGHVNVVTHLLQFKCPLLVLDVNLVDDGGDSGLQHACMNEHVDLVEVLLYSPKIKQTVNENDRRTPFMNACLNGNINVAKKFIECLENAIKNSESSDIEKITRIMSTRDLDGETAFHFACRSECEELVDWMIASKEKMEIFGIPFEAKNNKGETGYDLWPEKFDSSDSEDDSSTSGSSPRKRQRISE